MSSFGEELKRERELRQITLREISEATKISLRYLEAFERNDFTHLPGGVFNKGFVRAYAQFIGVDPEVMVNAYLLEERAQEKKVAHHVSATSRGRDLERAVESRTPASSKAAWKIVSVILLLVAAGVLVGMLVLWLRKGRGEAKSGEGGASAAPVSRLLGNG